MGADLASTDHRDRLRLWDTLRRPVWVFDPHRLCGVYANPAALKLWDAESLDELLSRDFSQLSPAVRARTDRMAQATAHGEEIAERWTFYPKGRPVTVQATISTWWLDEDRPVLVFEASPLEVEAEERRAVEALRHTSTLITLFADDGDPIFSNPAAFVAYGLNPPPFHERFGDQAQANTLLAQALSGEMVAEVCCMTTLNGERWHHLDARKVLDPVTGAAGVLLNEVDVTLQVEAEQAWAAAEKSAAMAQARQRFLTDMSHDLKTPLNSVIGFSALLKTAGLSPEQAQQAAFINDSGKHMLAVVEEMVRLSQLDGWTGEAALGPMELEAAPDADRVLDADPEPGALRVLYVDDNAQNRALVRAILATQGIECQTADDGAQGCQAAEAGDWDLILMDIQMPVMDGVAATRAIRASAGRARAVPIIAVTANTLSNQLEAYRAAGMNDCIGKPIDVAALLEKVIYWSEALEDEGAVLETSAG